jgi:hypothetical protein
LWTKIGERHDHLKSSNHNSSNTDVKIKHDYGISILFQLSDSVDKSLAVARSGIIFARTCVPRFPFIEWHRRIRSSIRCNDTNTTPFKESGNMSVNSKDVELSALSFVDGGAQSALVVNAKIDVSAPAIIEPQAMLPFSTTAELEALSEEKISEMIEKFSLQQCVLAIQFLLN